MQRRRSDGPATACNPMDEPRRNRLHRPFRESMGRLQCWYRHASGQVRKGRCWIGSRTSQTRFVAAFSPCCATTMKPPSAGTEIGDLGPANRLDEIHFEVTRKGVNERISLRAVCITPKHLNIEQITRNQHVYRAEKIAGGNIQITVTSARNGKVRFQHVQAQYEPNAVYGHAEFTTNLSNPQQTTLRQFYDGCSPRPMRDLSTRWGRPPADRFDGVSMHSGGTAFGAGSRRSTPCATPFCMER
jgi:hypothetical protein